MNDGEGLGDRFFPRGSCARTNFSVHVTADSAGWRYSGLQVVEIEVGEHHVFSTATTEVAVLPLSGGCLVEGESRSFDLTGREGVFQAVTDFAYMGIDTEVRITAHQPCEIALCSAEATRRIDPYYVAAQDVVVEVRGGGAGTRQINNFLSADVGDADKLVAVEVLTPAGNWSSYPPHKHDETTADEVELDEIYYFRIEGDHGTGFFSCYTTDGPIDDTVTVRDGDIYLVPRGFHGPAAATPGHNMYYLNVMAGPATHRAWRFSDDPRHAWVRDELEQLSADPRLPLTSPPT